VPASLVILIIILIIVPLYHLIHTVSLTTHHLIFINTRHTNFPPVPIYRRRGNPYFFITFILIVSGICSINFKYFFVCVTLTKLFFLSLHSFQEQFVNKIDFKLERALVFINGGTMRVLNGPFWQS
jgi:hypothetical protein